MSAAAELGVLRLPGQVLFGAGSVKAVGRLAAQCGRSVLVCTDPTMGATPMLADLCHDLEEHGCVVHVYREGVPELPLEAVDASVRFGEAAQPDVVIGFGGGSSIDLAKATALLLRHPGPLSLYYGENLVPGPTVPVIAVPTTSGTGSEVTPVAVVSDPGRELKVGISSPHLVPAFAVVDPELTVGCPPSVTAHSGIDALAHAVEAYTAGRRRPVWQEQLPVFIGSNDFGAPLALASIASVAASFDRVMKDPADQQARAEMSYASVCAGMAFGSAGTHLAHALQYAVGATTSTPHGLGVGLLLPYVLQVSRPAIVPQLAQVAAALGVAGGADAGAQAAVDAIDELRHRVGVPTTLAEIGVDRAQLPALAAQTMKVKRLIDNAAVPADEAVLLEILQAAWTGDRSALDTS